MPKDEPNDLDDDLFDVAHDSLALDDDQYDLEDERDDYARLQEAAAAVGLRPTTLARALVLNGATKVLHESAALRDARRP